MATCHDTDYRTLRASLLRSIACICERFVDVDSDDAVDALYALSVAIKVLRQTDRNLVNWLISGYGHCTEEDQAYLKSNEWIAELLTHPGDIEYGSA